MKILFVMVKEDYIDPMNIELLSALAKREGAETFLNVLEHGDLREDMRRIEPDIVAFSAKTGESSVMFKAARWLKESSPGVLTIMGGPHATFNYKQMQLNGESLRGEVTGLDLIAVGEADDMWPNLIRRLKLKQDIDDIPNLVTRTNRREDGSVKLLNRTQYLDDLPYLDRELVYEKTRLGNFGMRSFMASRGCPYICTYCFNAKFNQIYRGKGKTVNRYSVDRLLAELRDMVSRHPTQFIKFYDDIFTFRSDEWLIEFADKYPRAIGLPFHCLTRADLVRQDPAILEHLQRAGIRSISMSIESGNPFIRQHILKRGMTEQDIAAAFRLCRKMGINTFSNTILAIPAPVIPSPTSPHFFEAADELLNELQNRFKIKVPAGLTDPQEIVDYLKTLGLRFTMLDYDRESIDCNIKNGVTFGEFPTLHPYPGTAVTDYTTEIGAFDGDFERLHQNYQTESPFSCFSPEEKREQLNLSYLALVLLIFPKLRQVAYQRLAQLPLTPIYFFAYFVAKAYLIGFKIYPMRYSLSYVVRTLWLSFFTERLKHSRKEGKRFFRRRLQRLYSRPAILGGPWQAS